MGSHVFPSPGGGGGFYNTAVGRNALEELTTGQGNVACGISALEQLTSGNFNTAVGELALRNLQLQELGSCLFNVAVGYQAGVDIRTGVRNVFVGANAGFNFENGTGNTFIGESSAQGLSDGSGNIVIGHGADVSADHVGNEATIGSSFINRFRVPGVGLDIDLTAVPAVLKVDPADHAHGNVSLFGGAAPSFGAGVGVQFFRNATTNPSTNPTGGGILYADGGALKFRGSGGTVTTVAPA